MTNDEIEAVRAEMVEVASHPSRAGTPFAAEIEGWIAAIDHLTKRVMELQLANCNDLAINGMVPESRLSDLRAQLAAAQAEVARLERRCADTDKAQAIRAKAIRDLRAQLAARDAAIAEMENTARQKLRSEMNQQDGADADYEYGYEEIIRRTRAALSALPPPPTPIKGYGTVSEKPDLADELRRLATRCSASIVGDLNVRLSSERLFRDLCWANRGAIIEALEHQTREAI